MLHFDRSTLAFSLLLLLPALGCASRQRSPNGDRAVAEQREPILLTGGYKGKYNNDEQGHADYCVRLRESVVTLRYATGAPTGFSLTSDILVPQPGNGVSCPERGMARLDAREIVLSADGRPMFFHRGGWGFAGNDPGSAVHYGHIFASDIDSVGYRYERASAAVRPDSAPRGRWIPAPTQPWSGKGQQEGNGTACDSLSSKAHTVSVHSIPLDMKYLNSAQTSAIPYAIYGSPATDLGPDADRKRDIRYTMLTWSWINVRGGGVARALVRNGEKFYRCADVPAITLASVNDAQQKTPTGWVEAVYGAIPTGDGHRLYGWIVSAHRHGSDDVVRHLVK
jgi:hypothetical protein